MNRVGDLGHTLFHILYHILMLVVLYITRYHNHGIDLKCFLWADHSGLFELQWYSPRMPKLKHIKPETSREWKLG